jgi:hypothetical protein
LPAQSTPEGVGETVARASPARFAGTVKKRRRKTSAPHRSRIPLPDSKPPALADALGIFKES